MNVTDKGGLAGMPHNGQRPATGPGNKGQRGRMTAVTAADALNCIEVHSHQPRRLITSPDWKSWSREMSQQSNRHHPVPGQPRRRMLPAVSQVSIEFLLLLEEARDPTVLREYHKRVRFHVRGVIFSFSSFIRDRHLTLPRSRYSHLIRD